MKKPAKPPTKLRLLAKQAPARHWQAELEFLDKEMEFYQKLLKMGINNCPDCNKPALRQLLEEFSHYADSVVPALKLELSLFEPNGTEPVIAIAFQKKVESHQRKLCEMKELVFPHVLNLQKITIF